VAARRKRVSEVQDRRAGRARVVALGGAPTPVPAPPTGLLKPSITAWAAFWRSDVAQAVDQASDLPRSRRWIEVVPVAWLCPLTQVMGSFMLARFLGTQLHGGLTATTPPCPPQRSARPRCPLEPGRTRPPRGPV
jgi:hypothetical protein